jgi:leucyl-tRNA synthetase
VDRAIATIGRDLEEMRFNTAIASLMEFVRWARRESDKMASEEWARASAAIVLLMAPLAPHLAEELWARIGGDYSVHQQRWPVFDPGSLVDEQVTLVIQVDGKTRDRLRVPVGLDRQQALERAAGRENVRRHLVGEPRRVIFVPDRLINLVTGAGDRSA